MSSEMPENGAASKGYVVKRRGPSTARADFVCLHKACQTKKGGRVFELPANATHCPMGHKRLQRIYTAPHISRGVATRSDALVGPEYRRQQQKRDAGREVQRNSPMLAVDPKGPGGLSGAVSRALGMPVQMTGLGNTTEKAKPTLGITSPDLAGIKGAGVAMGPRPAPESKRWKPTADDIAAAKRNG